MIYPKIDEIYKRDEKGNFINGVFSRPEIEYLKDNLWNATEYIDGINIRIIWDKKNITFRGKKDADDIPKNLLNMLHDRFTFKVFDKELHGVDTIFFCESVGKGIKESEKYLSPSSEIDIFLLDTTIVGLWGDDSILEKISQIFNIKIRPIVGVNTLNNILRDLPNIKSKIKNDQIVDGVVCKPIFDLSDRIYRRIMCKIKIKDF
jgi:hypothetical protein